LKELPEFEADRAAESRLQRCIVERFGLAPEQPASVTAADDWMLAIEIRDLMATGGRYLDLPRHVMVSVREPWPPERAKPRILGPVRATFSQIKTRAHHCMGQILYVFLEK
jgi:hypothetical protein